jgi:hypothetical protein
MAESVPRRAFLRQVGLAGALALGLGSEAGWAAQLLSRGARGAAPGAVPALEPAQLALLSAAAEGMVPTTNTPGAIAAGVPAFIALLYAEWMLPAERAAFIAGLADLDRDCSAHTGHAFADCDQAQQLTLLRQWDATAARARREGTTLPYFAQLRTLVLIGYYTSEVGQVQELDVQYGGGASHAGGPMFSVPSRV